MRESERYAIEISKKAKEASKKIRVLSTETKNKVLNNLADEILKSKDEIIQENRKDIEEGKKNKLSESLLDRLLLNEARIEGLSKAVIEIAGLPDPVGEIVRGTTLKNGLELATKRVPLGVLLVIYESRPNVTIDVAALSFKSGNACILRGGSEAIHSNLVLSSIFKRVLSKNGTTEDGLCFVDKTDRAFVVPLLQQNSAIDIVVPRGGEGLIKFVTENSKIPVVKHDKGVCNIYIDETADYEKSASIILNSKTQRPGVCNAVENIVIHKNFSKIKDLLAFLKRGGVELLLDDYLLEEFPEAKKVTEEDYATEFLDLRLSAKSVDSIEEAIEFIDRYSSGHTEAILSENYANINYFLKSLDSAALFVNCSTRFHDGGEFGLGAEVGISTGKMHVRGPMGLVHLTTTTTVVQGTGQIRV
ncbi:MAG: glutamate-5-semialdehyde dehydrogenase [Leptospiraceae bacterium]|nr:glutamate-5-semialdehyde dehydrogenase [Leptospiraceae bacterium]MCP5497425.1 glutamate-5-semialdehyde dehydrogenase [Leptospiraceae bacterium]